MRKNVNLDNFYTDSNNGIRKDKGRKPPEITKEIKEVQGTKDGKPLTISNCKSIKLIVDDQAFTELDFKKLFPSRYVAFNIKKTYSNKKLKDSIESDESLYFYFPIQMLKEHTIKVICRKKMLEITYSISP